MQGKFRAVIKGYGASHGLRHGFEHVGKLACGQLCLSILWSLNDGKARCAFMGDQDGLPILGKEHEIGFPMPCCLTIVRVGGALAQRAAMLDDIDHAAARPGITAAPVLGAGQQTMPIILLRRTVIDEAVD